jgi:hypothetical protein
MMAMMATCRRKAPFLKTRKAPACLALPGKLSRMFGMGNESVPFTFEIWRQTPCKATIKTFFSTYKGRATDQTWKSKKACSKQATAAKAQGSRAHCSGDGPRATRHVTSSASAGKKNPRIRKVAHCRDVRLFLFHFALSNMDSVSVAQQ